MSEEFKIEKDVLIPPRRRGVMQKSPWPWPEMEVNDSVFCPAEIGEDAISIRSRIKTHVYARKTNKKFATRWVKHEGKLGLRVWRIE